MEQGHSKTPIQLNRHEHSVRIFSIRCRRKMTTQSHENWARAWTWLTSEQGEIVVLAKRANKPKTKQY